VARHTELSVYRRGSALNGCVRLTRDRARAVSSKS
jgi:hypothetical protein